MSGEVRVGVAEDIKVATERMAAAKAAAAVRREAKPVPPQAANADVQSNNRQLARQ